MQVFAIAFENVEALVVMAAEIQVAVDVDIVEITGTADLLPGGIGLVSLPHPTSHRQRISTQGIHPAQSTVGIFSMLRGRRLTGLGLLQLRHAQSLVVPAIARVHSY